MDMIALIGGAWTVVALIIGLMFGRGLHAIGRLDGLAAMDSSERRHLIVPVAVERRRRRRQTASSAPSKRKAA